MTKRKEQIDSIVKAFCQKIDHQSFYTPWIEQQENLLEELVKEFKSYVKPQIEKRMAELNLAVFGDRKLMFEEAEKFQKRTKDFLPQVIKSHFALQIVFLETMMSKTLELYNESMKEQGL